MPLPILKSLNLVDSRGPASRPSTAGASARLILEPEKTLQNSTELWHGEIVSY